MVHPPGFEPHLSPRSGSRESNSIPPGFEVNNKIKVTSVRKGSTCKNHIDSIGKRVTRNQSKQGKESVARNMSTLKKNSSDLGGREGNLLE